MTLTQAAPSNTGIRNAEINGQSPTASRTGLTRDAAFAQLLSSQLQAAGGNSASAEAEATPEPGHDLAAPGNLLPYLGMGGAGCCGGGFPSITITSVTIGGGPSLLAQGLGALSELAALLHGGNLSAVSDGGEIESAPALDPSAVLELSESQAQAFTIPTDPQVLGEKIGKRVAQIAEQGYPGIAFSVDHPEYGRIDVRADISNGEAKLSFGVQDEALREVLTAAESSLRETLAAKGLVLAEYNVTDALAPSTDAATAVAGAASGEPNSTDSAAQYQTLMRNAAQRGVLGLINSYA